jgi:hypothetical protein
MSFLDRAVRVLEEVGGSSRRRGGSSTDLLYRSCFGIVRADRAGAQLAQKLERVDAGRVSVAPVEADCIPAHRVDRERPDIQTTCVGIAMSMGALLLAGGTKGKRTALPNAKILLHQLSGGFEGQATDIEIQAREVITVKRRLEEIIAEHTGQPLERVSKDMERDYFMTSEQAQEYGIIDQVIAHH